MDFSRQLANLQRSATAASSSSSSARVRGGEGRGGGGDRKRSRDDDRYVGHSYRRNDDGGRGWQQRRRGGGRGGRWHGGGRGGGGRRREEDDEAALADLVRSVLSSSPCLRPRSPPASAGGMDASSVGGATTRHLALLFLTIDDLPFEHIWRGWVSGAGCRRHRPSSNEDGGGGEGMVVSVLCHAKFPERVTSPWLRERLLVERDSAHRKRQGFDGHGGVGVGVGDSMAKEQQQRPVRYHTRRPEWGSVEITRAMIDLVEEGLTIGREEGGLAARRYRATPPEGDRTVFIPPVDRFVFVSETCLPVATMEEAEVALFGDRASGHERLQKSAGVPPAVYPPNAHAEAERTDAKSQVAGEGAREARKGVKEEEEEARQSSTEAVPTEPTNRRPAADASSTDANMSWVNARNTPNNGYARQQQWDKMSRSVPTGNVWKADQWIVLVREHAEAVAGAGRRRPSGTATKADEGGDGGNYYGHGGVGEGGGGGGGTGPEMWQCFHRTRASDEMYFPTVLSLLGVIRAGGTRKGDGGEGTVLTTADGSIGDEVAKRRVTYCDWSMGAKNPASFDVAPPPNASRSWRSEFREAAAKAREEGCLFARKFVVGGGGVDGPAGGARQKQPRVVPGSSSGEGTQFTVDMWLDAIARCGKNKWFPLGPKSSSEK